MIRNTCKTMMPNNLSCKFNKACTKGSSSSSKRLNPAICPLKALSTPQKQNSRCGGGTDCTFCTELKFSSARRLWNWRWHSSLSHACLQIGLPMYLSSALKYHQTTVKVITGLIRCLYTHRMRNRLNKHITACSSTSVYEVFFRSIYRKRHRRLHGSWTPGAPRPAPAARALAAYPSLSHYKSISRTQMQPGPHESRWLLIATISGATPYGRLTLTGLKEDRETASETIILKMVLSYSKSFRHDFVHGAHTRGRPWLHGEFLRKQPSTRLEPWSRQAGRHCPENSLTPAPHFLTDWTAISPANFSRTRIPSPPKKQRKG